MCDEAWYSPFFLSVHSLLLPLKRERLGGRKGIGYESHSFHSRLAKSFVQASTCSPRGRQAPGVGTVMITTCTQFYFQTPHLDPAHALPIPELIGGDSGGWQSLVSSPEHLLQLLRYSRKKHADALLRHTTVQVEPPQHRMQRGEGA